MLPAPDIPHQGVLGEVYSYLRAHIRETGRGLVLMLPVDVELGEGNILQPDILVVLNEHHDRIRKRRVLGSPDLVVEIISPSSAVYDRLTKYEIYEQAGILEYWLVNVKRSTLEIFVLENGHYRSLGVLSESQIVHSPLVPDGKLPVREFFHWDEN